jgi:glycosyltransferase involved in cell wall biosynthesis
MTEVRAAVLIRQPIQHFAPALRMLADQPGLRVRTYYWTAPPAGMHDPAFGRHIQWDTDLYSGYDWWSPPAEDSDWARGHGIIRRLRRDRPQVLLCFGWASPVARLGIAFAAMTGTPLLYYGDSNWRAAVGGRRPRLRRLILRRLFRAAAGAVSTGAFNREFYIAHGMAPQWIHPGVYPTDVEAFRAAGRGRLTRAAAGGNGPPLVIGFAGKFVAIKGVDDLIEAAARLPRERRFELWLIGDGPLRSELVSLIARHGLTDRVRLLGFKNTDEVPALMAAVDIMVVPSRREPRGLVAVEAMAAGAATVVSSATGVWGPGDVLQHEDTGLVYPAGDVEALAGCLLRLMDDDELRTRLAAAGRDRAMSCGPAGFVGTTATALISTAGASTAEVSTARGRADVLAR